MSWLEELGEGCWLGAILSIAIVLLAAAARIAR